MARVRARSLLSCRAVRELGINLAAMARRLNISTVAESKSVARGAEIAKKDGLNGSFPYDVGSLQNFSL